MIEKASQELDITKLENILEEEEPKIALQKARNSYTLEQLASTFEQNGGASGGDTVDDIVAQMQAARQAAGIVETDNSAEIDEFLKKYIPETVANAMPLPLPDSEANPEECLAVVSDFINGVYHGEAPEYITTRLKDLRNGKLTFNSKQLEEFLSQTGRSPLEIGYTNGVATNDKILLRDKASTKTTIHEIMHFICEPEKTLLQNEEFEPIDTITNEALTELWTYFALKGVDINNPVKVFEAINFEDIKKFSDDKAGSYKSGFVNLMENILEMKSGNKTDFATKLPILFQSYQRRDLTAFRESLGSLETSIALFDISQPHKLDTIPLQVTMQKLLGELNKKYPQYSNIFIEFGNGLNNAQYKYPEVLLRDKDLATIRQGMSIYNFEGERVVSVALSLQEALKMDGGVFPTINTKSAYMLWQSIKYARSVTDKPITDDSLIFQNTLMHDFFTSMPFDEITTAAVSLSKVLGVKIPDKFYEEMVNKQSNIRLGIN